MKKALLIVIVAVLSGCTGLPEGVDPVRGFEVDRYLGRWYEIARLDHSFERGLERVTAEYSLRDDGGIAVLNRGFSPESGEWKEAAGRAYFADRRDVGHLEVSFFGPFYSSYVVFELDPEYRYAFVSGYDRSYLWLLARTPEVEPALLQHFREKAGQLGFAVDGLILVGQ
jgi:apolipoprotein D and lipocalin family protein